MATAVARALAAGRTVRVVCFGDSITGVYYHTGGRRAYCDMLGIALGRIYPGARVETANAGISGDDTVAALARIEQDVLAREPDLVTVMFGMNDCVRPAVSAETFDANLKAIARRCRDAGAEVVLCTPTAVLAGDPVRTLERVAATADVVRAAAGALSVPLADCHRVFEAVREKTPSEFPFLMSDAIHPNMNGHKAVAEAIAEVLSGARVRLDDVPPFAPSLPFTAGLLARGRPVAVVAMAPYDRIVPDILRTLHPGAAVRAAAWPAEGTAFAGIEAWGKGIRDRRPDLAVVAVPARVREESDEAYVRSYDRVLNGSLAFGVQQWDTIAVLPDVAGEPDSDADRRRAGLARRMIVGKDIGFVERTPGDRSSPEELLLRWIGLREREAVMRPADERTDT